MKLANNIIALVMAALILTGVALPSLGAAFPEINGPSEVPLTYLTGDALDDTTMTLKTDGGHVSVVSATWTGTIRANAIIVYTDKGSVYTDGTGIYSAFGNAVKTYAQLTVSLDSGTISVGTDSYPVTYAYWPWANGDFGSYANGTVSNPIAAVGSFAGVAVSGSGSALTTNTSDYIFEPVLETDDRKSIGFVPGEVDLPDVDPFAPDIEHEDDPEPEPVEPGEQTTSGTTGSCTWELDGTTLYVRGNGAMGSYSTTSGNPAPWGTGVESVILEEGVTGFGLSCFNGCRNLSYVSLPSTLVTIGGSAFINCKALTHIDIPEGVVSIGVQAFMGSGLKTLILPSTLRSLEQNVIRGCADLTHLYIPPTTTTTATQYGFHFIRIDGYDMGEIPTGDLYLGSTPYVMYQTKTVDIGGATYRVNYIGAELESAEDAETVNVPYHVTYNNREYTVESIAHGAISGASVKYVVIPQTIESISHTAITSPSVKEILNLSETEVTSGSARIATELPTIANIADATTDNSFGFYSMLVGMVVVVCLLGMSIKLLPKRRDDWE